MKKLLALVMVLGLAAVASAIDTQGEIGFTPVGPLEPVMPSDIFYIDILAYSSGAEYIGINSTGALTVTIEGPASFVGNTDFTHYVDFAYRAATPPPNAKPAWNGWNSMEVINAQTLVIGGGLPAGEVAWLINSPTDTPMMFDHIGSHCDGEGPVIITVMPARVANPLGRPIVATAATEWGNGVDVAALGGSITVMQIPEPMTMSLLGLGGLALIRRRRA
jgi:hypothetical protein